MWSQIGKPAALKHRPIASSLSPFSLEAKVADILPDLTFKEIIVGQ